MSWKWQPFRAVSDRAVPRSVRCCAILGGPLLMLLLSGGPVSAQQSDTRRWFEGVERGTDTPAVANSPPEDRRLRQPSQYGGRVRLAQARGAPPEALPTPPQQMQSMQSLQSQATSRVEGKLPMTGWDADVDIAQGADGRIDRLVVRDASLSKVLALLRADLPSQHRGRERHRRRDLDHAPRRPRSKRRSPRSSRWPTTPGSIATASF